MSKTLIAGSAYIDNEPNRELCKLWARVVDWVDPSVDVVIIDSASPFEPGSFLGWPSWDQSPLTGLPSKGVFRFSDNIGHLSRGGQDGAGRTFCKSIELAIEGKYDYLAIIETDLIFMRSVRDVIRRMANNGTKVAAVPNAQYYFPEFGLCFFDVEWVKEFKFVEKYDWKHSQPWPIPEIRIMNILEDYLMLLPLYGARIDQMPITSENLPNFWPYFPPAWLTHAPDINTYLRGLMLNNIRLP